MLERGESTRPQLATATGLSLVSVGKVVRDLCRSGELLSVGEVSSGGGRPVQVYRYNADYAAHVLLEVRREAQVLCCAMRVFDLQGRERSSRERKYTYLEKESLDGMLDEALRRTRVRSIMLLTAPELLPLSMKKHLSLRYGCPVQLPDMAVMLATEKKDGTAVLCLPEGEAPSCAYCRNGEMVSSGPLHLLPVMGSKMDYSDRSQVVERVAQYIQIITCTLAPQRLELYTPPLSSRLTERIRYTAETKLREYLPELNFISLTPRLLEQSIRTAIIRLTN